MIRVTFRHHDGNTYTDAFPRHLGMRTEQDAGVVSVFGTVMGGAEETLASVSAAYFVAASTAADDMMGLAEAVGVYQPDGFEDPPMTEYVHTMLDGTGQRRVMTGHLEESPVINLGDRRRPTDEQKG